MTFLDIPYKYEGEWLNDYFHGYGEIYYNESLIYNGTFIRDSFGGIGTSYNNGKIKIINSSPYNPNGYILITDESGMKIKMTFIKGRVNGNIIIYYKNNKILFEGHIFNFTSSIFINKNILWDGYGAFYNEEGIIIYKGAFKHGLYDGEGKEYHNNGKIN